MMVFLRSMRAKSPAASELRTADDLLLAGDRLGAGAAILLQLVVQRLQTDAENFRGPGFIVAGRFQSLQDEHFLSLFDGCADSQADRIGIVGRGAKRRLPKSWRQMLGLDHSAIADDHRSLDGVAQLANVARP